MKIEKKIEMGNGGLVLITNEFSKELKKLMKEVLTETNVACGIKPNPVTIIDSKPSAPQFKGDRLIRLNEVLELIPVSRSHWYDGIKKGRYPAPLHHLGSRISAWSLSSIMSLINGEVQP